MNNHEFHMINEEQLKASQAKEAEAAAVSGPSAALEDGSQGSYLQSYASHGSTGHCGLPELVSTGGISMTSPSLLKRSGSSPVAPSSVIPPMLSLKSPFASFGTSRMHPDGSYSLAPITMKYR